MLCGLAGAAQAQQDRPGAFDYYVLALSWSPTYCAGAPDRRDEQQCRPGRGYAFVVHGLWPQYWRGWPSYCPTENRWVPSKQIRAMLDIMPSKRLVIHEWKKHGTCSGLDQRSYFSLTRELFDKMKIPARYLSPNKLVRISPRQLIADFVKTNKGMGRDMLMVDCGNRRGTARLRELRICFTRNGEFMRCGGNEKRQCRAETLIMPPVR